MDLTRQWHNRHGQQKVNRPAIPNCYYWFGVGLYAVNILPSVFHFVPTLSRRSHQVRYRNVKLLQNSILFTSVTLPFACHWVFSLASNQVCCEKIHNLGHYVTSLLLYQLIWSLCMYKKWHQNNVLMNKITNFKSLCPELL